MQDADLLSISDATGAALWHPRGLEDLERIPERTLTLWHDMRDGLMARSEPWAWLRARGIPTAHQYAASPLGPTVARCGHRPGGDELVPGGDVQCRACVAAIERDNRPRAGWGRIGDSILGPDGHPLGGEA